MQVHIEGDSGVHIHMLVSLAFLLLAVYDDRELQNAMDSRELGDFMRDLTPNNAEELAHLAAGLQCLAHILWETQLQWEEQESAMRTNERTRAITGEMMAKAWHPRRMLSCLDTDELAELHRDGWIA